MNTLIIILAVSAFIFLIVLAFLFLGPFFPKGIDVMIKEVQNSELPERIKGETGTTDKHDVSIYYESLTPKGEAKATILLINGHTRTLLDWPDYFYQPLVDAGYHVVRFDNRGVGMSDWMPQWGKENKYTLEDMAGDALAVLDALSISQAHIIGVSMGGMISQRLAISHGDRVLSLTSIMSTGNFNDSSLTNVPKGFMLDLIRLNLRFKRRLAEEFIKLKYQLGVELSLEGKGDYASRRTAAPRHREIIRKALYEVRKRSGYNARAVNQHSVAIMKSGSRYEELGLIRIPTLIIHGEDDPLILIDHAHKYAAMIEDSKTLFIKGMGHDLPQVYIKKMIDEILNMTERLQIRQ